MGVMAHACRRKMKLLIYSDWREKVIEQQKEKKVGFVKPKEKYFLQSSILRHTFVSHRFLVFLGFMDSWERPLSI